jgi:molecular chaperone IbpA
MHAYDLSPLFRSTIGFDRLSHMIDSAFKADERTLSYPPYNILKHGDDDYRIIMAVAGFKREDLTITAQENQLTVSGTQSEPRAEEDTVYLHKGIATRSFERKFSLADHVKVVDADLADGLLTLHLKREVPEESKPKVIAINQGIDGGKFGKIEKK